MKRATGVTVLLLAATGGCMAPDTDTGPAQYMAHVWTPPPNNGPHCGVQPAPATVPGVYGPRGTPVTMIGPYNMDPPSSESAAHDMLNKSVPLDMVRRGGLPPGMPGGIIQTAGTCPPGGCPPGMPGMPGIPGIPPPGMPGMPGMPAVPGAVGPAAPGVGLAPPTIGPYGVLSGPPGSVAAVGALTSPVSPYPIQRTEVRFAGPSGMRIAWYSPQPGGKAGFGPQYLEAPARYNFLQASIYRLKLSDIPNRPGLELYPTLEVVPAKARTCAFLAHSAVPVTFTDADFDQVAAGNYVVKVIYLPDPQFQDLAATGIDELVSTQLEPGVDPIAVAQARGSILLVIRMGNIDLEAPNTPAMDAPNPFCKPPAPQGPPMPPAGPGPAGMGGRPMVPYTPVSRPGMPPGMPGMPPGMPMMPPGMPMMGPGQMMMPPTGMPPGMPSDGLPPRQLPGAPLGQLPSPDQLQQTRYKAPSGPRPTLAELASQPAGGTTSGSK